MALWPVSKIASKEEAIRGGGCLLSMDVHICTSELKNLKVKRTIVTHFSSGSGSPGGPLRFCTKAFSTAWRRVRSSATTSMIVIIIAFTVCAGIISSAEEHAGASLCEWAVPVDSAAVLATSSSSGHVFAALFLFSKSSRSASLGSAGLFVLFFQ